MIHLAILETSTFHWSDEAACQRFAQALSRQQGLFDASIELYGGLGAGKTTFVRHLLRALGVSGRIKSPSYAVLESYELQDGSASHFDFFRFEDPREWEDAGFRELFAEPGLKLSEWPEKAAGYLPEPDLRMYLGIKSGEAREVRVEALTPVGQTLLQGLKRDNDSHE